MKRIDSLILVVYAERDDIMTVKEAKEIAYNYYYILDPTEEDDFIFTEALIFLIKKTKDPHFMLQLGGFYRDKNNYELALKYYEMAEQFKTVDVYSCLGFFWERCGIGESDYEKAYKYYSLAAELGDLMSEFKVAEMYKKGRYVERDYEKYKSLLESLYTKIKALNDPYSPLPIVFISIAKIRAEDGKIGEAISRYLQVKNFIADRVCSYPFFGEFGDFDDMDILVYELYKLIDFDYSDFNLYDLFYLLTFPNKISFRYKKKTYHVESVIENDECIINFEGQWYRTRNDFFSKAVIGEKRLTEIYNDLYMFEVK